MGQPLESSPPTPQPCTAPTGSPALYSCGEAHGLSLLLAWGSEQKGPARAQGQTLPFIFRFFFPPASCFFHQLHPALPLAHPCPPQIRGCNRRVRMSGLRGT